ncbi:LEAF RUST 10 DISEASE-RESISTANCE LOCUS RECEPTOR-LIKE PROTEIN KINASE-like 2.7 [Pistacia vera]|uniref:LEAF RUST 10 DISEASE-RESISTANCE LOCUS RECEPTOR-LIKE PROTEIN KINASE-like 2.7 n=1 Tax=Pistacia vera TaxID=55513 RepID=UPI001263775C|nr:LEAF RUST 10 DISEASE-RESISTANCE LOCUS RECEPTOR-LIKE PROTEIN KINASE-like 2.7 [Pistacia vera]
MENFLLEMEREKPVRFTAQQLDSFTSNYSTRFGSGGFGSVFKGQFPNGERIAIKVLKWSVDRRAEAQFMAEVGAIGRTYHLNLVRLYGFCHDQFMSALVYEYMENGEEIRVLVLLTASMLFPKHVWEVYEKGEVGAVTLACVIEEREKEKAEGMCKVALWCVQDSPEARSPMSAVVKMLEGGVEIVPLPKPFQ